MRLGTTEYQVVLAEPPGLVLARLGYIPAISLYILGSEGLYKKPEMLFGRLPLVFLYTVARARQRR